MSDTLDQLAQMEQSEDLRKLMACLDKLDGNRREIVVLAYCHGLSREDLSRRFSAPVADHQDVAAPEPRAIADVSQPMSDQEDIDALAAEYVLGTLSLAERAAVSARRQRERDLDAAIEAWEMRLAPLTEATPSVEPSPELLAAIEANISEGTGNSAVVELQQRVARWRRLAIAASAAAACLLVALGVREFTRMPQPVSYVGVFQKDDQSPAFLLTVDLQTRMLSIRVVSADRPADKTYQLWIASEQRAACRSRWA